MNKTFKKRNAIKDIQTLQSTVQAKNQGCGGKSRDFHYLIFFKFQKYKMEFSRNTIDLHPIHRNWDFTQL